MKLFGRVFLAAFLVFVTTGLVADDDPPGRVARLQYMSGSVSIQPGGVDDWVAGTLNRPLTTADNIWTDKDSRAELSVGTGILRMNSEASLTLTNVNDGTVQLQLHQGTLNLHVRKLYDGEIYEVDTPNTAFTVQKSGEYRFDVGADGDYTLVTVWKGEGDASGDGPAVRVKSGERARFTGGTSLSHDVSQAPRRDGFDDWCVVRDRRQDHALSARYVSPDMIGSEDLDEYGNWRTVSGYGPVWVPSSVAPGWAPYRYGHWVWISPWGWTWVDDAAWGFAPFHYGRWIYTGGYWGWSPGPYYGRPIYAPALVAWFGGRNWGVNIGFGGGYGWCPLGFGEPFIPWYAAGPRYFRNVNIYNTRITNINYITNNYYNRGGRPRTVHPVNYANLRAPGGMTAVPGRTVVGSLPVNRSMMPVSLKDAQQLGRAPLRDVSLSPTRESRLGVNAGRPTAAPPQRTFGRPVVSKQASPSMPARNRGDEVASLNRGDRPMNRTLENRPAAASPSGRMVPRPPQRAEGPGARDVADARTPGITRSPMSGDSSTRSPKPAIRSVPRPPEGSRPMADNRRDASPVRTSRADTPRGMDNNNDRRSAAPAVRSVPRPPAGVQPHAAPRSQEGSSHSRGAVSESPRSRGPVASSRGPSYDERGPRMSPPSSSHRDYPGPSSHQTGSSSHPSGGYPSRSSAPAPSHSAPSHSTPSHGASQHSSPAPSHGASSGGGQAPRNR